MIQSKSKLKEIIARITMGITLIVVAHVISNFLLAGFGLEPLAIKGIYHELELIVEKSLDVSYVSAILLVNSMKLALVIVVVLSTISAAGDWVSNNESFVLSLFPATRIFSLIVLSDIIYRLLTNAFL